MPKMRLISIGGYKIKRLNVSIGYTRYSGIVVDREHTGALSNSGILFCLSKTIIHRLMENII